MSNFFKKKGIVLSVLLLMVAGAIFVNWKYTDNTNNLDTESAVPGEVAAVTTSNVEKNELTEQQQYLADAKKDREKTVSDSITELKGIENNAALDSETRNNAAKQRTEIYENSVLESAIEELIIAKGYNDCVVVINKDNISIAVMADKLEGSDTVQIIDIVQSQSNYTTDKIKIMNI